jgi:rhamnulokinase
MKTTGNFLAVDLGASVGRVLNGLWDGTRFEVHEVHRFSNTSVQVLRSLHWDALRLWAEVKEGLALYHREYRAAPVGIGLDAWGVDFALLDKSGRLVGNPYSYRDTRTTRMPDAVFAHVPKEELFRQTGIQPWQINTLFQLYSMVRNADPQLKVAETLLMLPDLFSYWLSGEKSVEFTEGTTSGMLRTASSEWASELLTRLEVPVTILPAVVKPGTILAPLAGEVAQETGFETAPPVIAVAAHDTASAVAAIPGLDANSVFISSGTWSLMGVETDAPVPTPEALALGFTNEGGVGHKVLLLRNITGLWLLQQCMRRRQREGVELSWELLMGMAEQAPAFRSVVDPDAKDFVAPDDMVEAIRGYCQRTGQPLPDSLGAVARCCLESLSLRYRWVLEALETLTRRSLSTIRVVGGGCQNRLLCQFTADACRRPVVAGPVEASALGNIMVQAVATGHLAHIEDGRRSIAASCEQAVFEPRAGTGWDEAYQRFWSLIG